MRPYHQLFKSFRLQQILMERQAITPIVSCLHPVGRAPFSVRSSQRFAYGLSRFKST